MDKFNEVYFGDEFEETIDEFIKSLSNEVRKMVIESIKAEELDNVHSSAYKDGYARGREAGIQEGYEEGILFTKLKDQPA